VWYFTEYLDFIFCKLYIFFNNIKLQLLYFVNDDFLALPTYSVDSLNSVDEYDARCRWSNCWDVFNCSSLTVFAPPLEHFTTKSHGQVTPSVSREFYAFYKWLSESEYYTSNPQDACIRIPPIDLFSLQRVKGRENIIGAILRQQPYWNQGKNSLIVTMSHIPQGITILGCPFIRSRFIREKKLSVYKVLYKAV